MIEHLTAETFKEKVFNYAENKEWKFEGEKPCLIDFYADWCMPCKMVAPLLEELSEEYKGKLNIYKVDTESERELAAIFGSSEYTFTFIRTCRWSAPDGYGSPAQRDISKGD